MRRRCDRSDQQAHTSQPAGLPSTTFQGVRVVRACLVCWNLRYEQMMYQCVPFDSNFKEIVLSCMDMVCVG